MALPRWKQQKMERAKEWILANPNASIAETMRACEISMTAVQRIRKNLIAGQVLQPYAHTPYSKTPEKLAPTQTPDLTTAELLEAERILDDSQPMDRDFRRKKLEALVRHGAADHIIRANEAIERMESRDGSKEEIGPPPPETLDEAIDQTTDIIEALAAWGGEDAVKKAVTRGMARHLEEEKRRSKLDTAAGSTVTFEGGDAK